MTTLREAVALQREAKKLGAKAWGEDTEESHEKAIRAHDKANRALWDVISDAPFDSPLRARLKGAPEAHTAEEQKHKKRIDQIRNEAYQQKKDTWSRREVMSHGSPPKTMNVLDQHGGDRQRVGLETRERLKKGTIGSLDSVDSRSFFQNNYDVTLARYRLPGYRYLAMA